MTIIIDGTLGISGVDGSAGTPAYAGNDSDTGLWYPASNTLALSTGGTERMRIDSSGNVGIGTSSPSALLSVNGRVTLGDQASSGTAGAGSFIVGGGAFYVQASQNTTSGSSRIPIIFSNIGGSAESMRIDSSGNVGIGTASPNIASGFTNFVVSDTDNGGIVYVDRAGGARGYFYANGTSSVVLGNTSSIPLVFNTADTERMRITSGGDLLVGTTSATAKFVVNVTEGQHRIGANTDLNYNVRANSGYNCSITFTENTQADRWTVGCVAGQSYLAFRSNSSNMGNGDERMRIESGGNVLVGTTVYNDAFKGILLSNNGRLYAIADGAPPLTLNRLTNDGDLVEFKQAGTIEGTISVSGTTVSYNGGHLSRWSQLPNNQKDDTLLKGTVMSNLDDMCVWVKEGEELPNEQLNKMKVSDVEGDTNVAGVFVNWTFDEQCQSDDMNIAMTGDMIIRIAQSVVVQKGDLLMSAGDGTAKPQGDDIRRSKTVAKVTSNHVTCTYADGSYCVPCVLMAC